MKCISIRKIFSFCSEIVLKFSKKRKSACPIVGILCNSRFVKIKTLLVDKSLKQVLGCLLHVDLPLQENEQNEFQLNKRRIFS